MKDNDIKERWREYFSKLLNEDYVGDVGTREETLLEEHTFFRRIKEVEVRKALKQMKTGKALGSDDILIKAWKCL